MATARRARLSTDARREQLVALGVEMFSERPFDEVSIDDIAASAGISKGLLYHYFPSKRDFYVAVVRHSADEMQAVTETDPDLAPLERLSAGLDRYLEYVDTHARGYSTVLRAGIGSDREVAAIVEDVRSAMANRILDDFPGDEPAARRPHRGARLGRLRRGGEPRVARAPRAQPRRAARPAHPGADGARWGRRLRTTRCGRSSARLPRCARGAARRLQHHRGEADLGGRPGRSISVLS